MFWNEKNIIETNLIKENVKSFLYKNKCKFKWCNCVKKFNEGRKELLDGFYMRWRHIEIKVLVYIIIKYVNNN